jgi:MoaA/NifB/PqqE/SkfB family radical SAM enzyme
MRGHIDLTYRCNNNCRHCWLRISPDAKEKSQELNLKEIKSILDDAKKLGCSRWHISGGEPMLRPDFAEIFDYITSNSIVYSINTNGALITPKIAKLMARKGRKMVALYGATADVHDHVTRNPGSFDATIAGFRYLKEAGTGFIVQLIPMRDNYHQFQDMVKLAGSLSRHYRVGTAWLYLSACGDRERNAEIIRQRLPAKEVVKLDNPDMSHEELIEEQYSQCGKEANDKYLFSSCISNRRDFHIDPYGKMTFCSFIKDPRFCSDLRNTSFQDSWEKFIPSLATKVRITEEYKKDCYSCGLKKDCRISLICPVYGYLEHRDFNKKVEYQCDVAQENKKFKENWQKNHCRYFKIADITVQVESDLPINKDTLHPKFKLFEVDGPGEDTIRIRHYFSLPDLGGKTLGKEVYRKAPWAIYKNNGSWVYLEILPKQGGGSMKRVVTFNSEHTRAIIYNDKDREKAFLAGDVSSLTMLPSDQILLCRILADRGGFCLHSCGVNFEGKGLLFAGHSEAGKSTMATMLQGKAEILCDDRMIARKQQGGFRIYGTWSHGDVPDVSANSAPLTAIMFLKKAGENKIIPITDKKEVTRRILACLIKPFITADWWEKTLSLIEDMAITVPCYELYFDKSGKAVEILRDF